jgi:hypothetical protein
MWLAETAADTESLELLAQHGIKFTVLAPHQCKRVRVALGRRGMDRHAGRIRGYHASIPVALQIRRFDCGVLLQRPASRAIAFEGLLNSGENFAARLKSGFKEGAQPQLVHVATDGESYGHHHKHGEMALAYALLLLERTRP